jgi:thioredoxin 1
VVDAFATWCPPCRAVAPKFEKLSEEYSNVTFIKFNADKQEELAKQLEVDVMPTFYIIVDGEVTVKILGANIAKIKELLDLKIKQNE